MPPQAVFRGLAGIAIRPPEADLAGRFLGIVISLLVGILLFIRPRGTRVVRQGEIMAPLRLIGRSASRRAFGCTGWAAALWPVAAMSMSWARAAVVPGSILAWGGSVGGPITPPAVSNGQTVAIAAASGHSLALLSTGAVVAWGSNASGESNVPDAASHDVIAIAAGYSHSMASTSAGQVIVWGANSAGQATVPGAAQSNVIQIAAGDSHCLALRSDGSVVAWGANGFGQSLVPTAALSGITRIAAGAFHSLAVTTSGSVVAWGNNLFGQIGAPNGDLPANLTSGVAQVAAGRYHSAFLKSDGSVIALGGVGYGEANVPNGAKSQVVSIVCGHSHTLALKADGSVVGWGDGSYGQTTLPASVPLSDYAALAAGETFSLALFTNPLPQILSGPQSLTVWGGRPATLSASVFGGAIQWQLNGVDVPGATSATLSLKAAKLEDAGLYTVIARNASGSVTSAPPAALTVNWPKAPVISKSPPDMNLLEGVYYNLMECVVSGDDLTLQWTKDGVPIPDRTQAYYYLGTAALNWPGVYTLVASNGAGSVTSAPPTHITVTPAKVPVITISPGTVTVPARNAQVVFTANVEADYVYGYEWLKNGSVIPGKSLHGIQAANAYSTTLDLGNPDSGDAGDYSFRVYSNAGVFTSSVVPLTVTPHVPAPPVITSAPVSATVTQGDSVRFDVVATGRGLGYQWTKDDADLPGQTGSSLVIASANLIHAGSYRVRVTNEDGSVTSDPPAILTVNALQPVTIVTPPAGAALTAGDPLRLSVVASGNTKTYQWKRNGVAIYGATNSTYRLVRSLPRHAGEYTVEISDGFSTATNSPAAVVTVSPSSDPLPTGGVVELQPVVSTSSFYYDSKADISVPPEAQSGVVALSTFREANLAPASGFGSWAYMVHRLALLADGRVVTWGYDFSVASFSINPYFSQSYSGVDSSPENSDGLIGIGAGVTDRLLRSNGSISGFSAPNPADEGSAFVDISSCPIRSIVSGGVTYPTMITHLLALRNNGSVAELENGGPVPVAAQSGVRAIAAGSAHSVALREDGSVLAWSTSDGSLLSVPPLMTSQVLSITADETGFGALTADGTVVYQPLSGAAVIVPPQPGVSVKSGTPAFAITTDRRAVTWDGAHWNPAAVPEWTQGRILQRSGTCLLVTSGAPVIAGPIQDQAVEEAKAVTLHVPGGGAGAAYQWFKDGTLLAGATNRDLNLGAVSSIDAGGYTVAISNAAGSVTSSPAARLTVLPPPNLEMYVSLSVTNSDPNGIDGLPAHLRRGVVQIRGGAFHCLTLRYDGTVRGWTVPSVTQPYRFTGTFYRKYSGFGYFGQGDVPEAASHDVVEVDAWGYASQVLKSDGTVIGWGSGGSYVIPPSSIRTIHGGLGLYFINTDGGVLVRNGSTVSQTDIPAAARSGVVALACTDRGIAYALRGDGTVVALNGSTVPPPSETGIIALSAQTTQAGQGYVLAARQDGSIVGWSSDGTRLSFDASVPDIAGFVDGVAFGPNYYSTLGGIWLNKSGGAGSVSSSISLSFPQAWQGRIVQFGYNLNPSLYFALIKSDPQSIQFDAIANRRLGDGPLTLSATASSGLPVSFRVVSGPAVVDGNRLTFQGAGEVTVTAEQGGDTTTAVAVPVTRTFVVESGTQTIEFAAVPPIVWGSGPVGLSATASSGLPVQFSVVSGPGSVVGNQLTPTGAGVVVVLATQPGNAQYQSASATQSISVLQAPQTIAFAPVGVQTLGGAPVTLAATSSSGLPVVLSIVSGPGALNGNVLTATGAGVVVVQGSQAGNGTYLAASATLSVVVNPASQVITFVQPANVSMGSSPIPLVATSSRGLPVSFQVSSGPATVSGNQLTLTGVGVVTVVASQAGDTNTAPAEPVTRQFTVTKRTQTITFASVPALTYGAAPVTLSATTDSGLTVSFFVISGPGSINGNALTVTGVGTLLVQAVQLGNDIYQSASAFQTFTVSPSDQQITFELPGTIEFTTDLIAVHATANSGLPVRLQVLSGPASLSGDQLRLVGLGTVQVSAEQPGDANHRAARLVRTLVVQARSQSLAVVAPTNRVYAPGTVVTLSGTASSGLPVTFALTSGPGTLNGDQLSILGAGTFQLTASQSGNDTVAAAKLVAFQFEVTRAPQTLTFAAIENPTLGPDGIPLIASSSSGLTVAFTVLDGSATVQGTTLKLTSLGAVHVAADQGGDANYLPAVRQVQTLQVVPGLSLVPSAPGTPGRSSLEIFLPAGQSGEVEQCDQLGNWTSLGTVRGAGGDVPATLLVIPPPGTASSRFWRIRTSQ